MQRNPEEQLRALHGEDPGDHGSGGDIKGDVKHAGLRRSDILVVEADKDVRAAEQRLLGYIFPGYNIEEARNCQDAVPRIAGDLRQTLALVLADVGETDDVHSLIQTLRQARQDIPLLLTSAGGSDFPAGQADGFIAKPFMMESLEQALSEAISTREGVFGAINAEARRRVLKDFLAYYKPLVSEWERNLETLSAYGKGGDLAEDLQVVLNAIGDLKIFLEGINPDVQKKVDIHRLNNILTVLISYPGSLIEDLSDDPDKEIVKTLAADARKLQGDATLINKAQKGMISWNSADQPPRTPEAEDVLRCPEGMRFGVIDDNQNIRKICERVVAKGGGTVNLAFSDGHDLQIKLTEALREGYLIDVFLLDHELGDNAFGYQLIDQIRAVYPDALIIAHTGEAATLNEDPENPYKKAGIEVVGKREWNAVSGIIRRKLNPSQAE